RTRDNIGTAPDNGLQGARTTRKIRNRHIQAFVFDKTLAFSHRQRQVIRECLAAHSDMHLLTLKCLSTYKGRASHQCAAGGGNFQYGSSAYRHDCLLGLDTPYGTRSEEHTSELQSREK